MIRATALALALALAGFITPHVLAQPAEGAAATDKAPQTDKVPQTDITPRQLYTYLVGELAAQRGDFRTAAEAFSLLAGETADARLARRAAEAALQGGDPLSATRAVRRWQELDPDNPQAEQTLIAVLLSRGEAAEAKPYLQRLLAREPRTAGPVFMQLAEIVSRSADKAGVQLLSELARPYPQLPEARYATAQAARAADQSMLAITEAKAALDLRADWMPAVLLYGELLAAATPKEAAKFYRDHLARNPKAREVRIALARALAAQQDFSGARKEYELLLAASPGRPENYLAVALLSVDLKDYPAAEKYLKKTIELGFRDPGLVYAYLGQVYEEQNRHSDALAAYRQVSQGEQYFASQLRIAMLLAKQGDLEAGRGHLRSLAPGSDGERLQVTLADAQLLRDARQYQEAFDVLSAALAKNPDSTELLYDRAMAAEKLSQFDTLETDLRKVMTLKPDFAHAYNALGYTFAEHGMRLDEALQLIEKAHKLAPNDPFILDSLGWVHFRLGNSDKGLAYLKSAMAQRPDPEIAAHLAEVLLARGDRAEARNVTRTALAKNPDNEALQAVSKKIDAP